MMATMPHLVPEKHLVRINTLDQTLASAAKHRRPPVFRHISAHDARFSRRDVLDFIGAVAAVARTHAGENTRHPR